MLRVQDVHGVLPAFVTPLTSDGDVDERAARRLIDHVLQGGVHGVLVLGSTGEGATLAERERRRVVEVAAEQNAGRVPLLAGVARVTLAEAKAELRALAQAGVLAALVTPPFYAPLDQPAVLDFYRRLAADAPIPVLVYNIPQFTKVSIEPPTLRTLAEEGAVVGVKDSSGNFGYHLRMLRETAGIAGFRAFTGSEAMLLASLTKGGCGTICATSNIAPALCVSVYERFKQGDLEAARKDQYAVLDIVSAIGGAGSFPSGFKAALNQLGLMEPWCVPPSQPPTAAQLQAIRDVLARYQLLAAVAV